MSKTSIKVTSIIALIVFIFAMVAAVAVFVFGIFVGSASNDLAQNIGSIGGNNVASGFLALYSGIGSILGSVGGTLIAVFGVIGMLADAIIHIPALVAHLCFKKNSNAKTYWIWMIVYFVLLFFGSSLIF